MLRLLGTWEPGHWFGLASSLWLDPHWHFLLVLGIDLCPAAHTLSLSWGYLRASAVGV